MFWRSRLKKGIADAKSPRRPASQTFHIFTPTLVPHDAVSNDVLGMRNAIRNAGFECFAYAEHIAPTFAREATLASKIPRGQMRKNKDVLIMHHSTLWEYGESIYNGTNATKILKYHNVTPAEYFRGYSDLFYRICESGRQQTARLVKSGADLFLADSMFNLQELQEFGADPELCHVVSPFHHADALFNTHASTSTLEMLLDGHVNICFVGRFAPNKAHVNLIRTFAYFRRVLERRARLVLVGKFHDQLESYIQIVQAEIVSLGVRDSVVILDSATVHDLRAVYLASHIFLCLSEHEGFCVPLIEAMMHKIPIVALSRAAVPETLGTNGLLADNLDEVLISEMMAYCIQEKAFNTWLTNRQHERYVQMFTNEAILNKLLSVITPLTESL